MKKFIIIGGVVVFLLLFLWIGLPLFFDSTPTEKKLTEHIKQSVDIDIKINGDKSLSIFPFPAFTVSDVELVQQGKNIGKIDEIRVGLDFIKLFDGELVANKIKLTNLEIKEKLDLKISKEYSEIKPTENNLQEPEIEIINGIYDDITNINCNIKPREMLVDGSFTYKNENLKVSLSFPRNKANFLEAKIEHSLINVDIVGEFNEEFYDNPENLKLKGETVVNLKDMQTIYKKFIKDHEILDQYKIPKNMSFKGKFKFTPTKLYFKEMYGKLNGEDLGISIEYPFYDRRVNPIAISVAMDNLNFDKLIREDITEPIIPKLKEKEIPKDIFISLDFSIKNCIINGQSVDIKKLRGDVVDGEIVLQPSVFSFAGDNTFTIFGMLGNESSIIEEEKNHYRFAGKVEFIGEDLRAVLLIIAPSFFNKLPEESLKKFKMTGDIFITGREFRVSNIILKFDETELIGAILVDIRDIPDIEIAIKARNLKVDDYLPENMVFFKTKKENGNEKDILNEINTFSWIEKNKWTTRLNIKVKNLEFKDKFFNQVGFGAILNNNVLSLRDIKVVSDELSISGNTNIIVNKEFPQIDANLKFGDIDTANFIEIPKDIPPFIEKRAWSVAPLTFDYLSQFNSKFHLEFNSLTHYKQKFGNLKTSGKVEKSTIDVKKFKAKIFEGALDTNFMLSIHNVPSLEMSFSLANINTKQFMEWFTGTDNITGRISLSGNLKTSGIHRKSWSSQLTGIISVLSKPFIVEGFELPTIVRKVSNLRTVADIINISRLALRNGKTKFDTMKGNFVIVEGKVTTPTKLKLESSFTNGESLFDFNFTDKKIDILSQFGLEVRFCDVPAVLKVRLKGKLDKMDRVVDTKYLENYVAKCEALRMINQ